MLITNILFCIICYLTFIPNLIESRGEACTICTCYRRKDQKYVDCSYLDLDRFPDNIPLATSRLLLNGNQITDVGYNNAFPYLPNLRILHLHNNPITQIHPDAFQNVSHIHTLLLHFTDITTVDNQMLVPLTRLKWFWANNAKLTSIGTNPFQYNPNIIEIYLQYNDLSNITNGIWKNLHDLKHLYLHGNTNLEEPTCCTLCNAAPDVDLKWTGMTPGTEDEMGLTGIRKVKLPCGCEGGTSIVCPGVAELCFVDEICNDYVFSSANSLFGSFRNRLILTITMIIIACFSI